MSEENKCHACGKKLGITKSKSCPHCGVLIDKKEEEGGGYHYPLELKDGGS